MHRGRWAQQRFADRDVVLHQHLVVLVVEAVHEAREDRLAAVMRDLNRGP